MCVFTVSARSTVSNVSNDVILPAGSTLNLDCKFVSGKLRTYRWYHNGNRVGSTASYSKKGVTVQDSGVYCCQASVFNKGDQRCLSVDVYGKTERLMHVVPHQHLT